MAFLQNLKKLISIEILLELRLKRFLISKTCNRDVTTVLERDNNTN